VRHWGLGFRVRVLGIGFCVRVRVKVSVKGNVSYLNVKFVVFRSSPPYIRTSTIKLNPATNQIVAFVKVDASFMTISLSRSSEVRVKVT